MKISIVTSPFGQIPPNATGAVEKLSYDLAQEFVKHGNEVTFYCCGGGEKGKHKYVHLTPYKRSGNIKIDLMKDFLYSVEMFFKLAHTDILVLNTFWAPILARFFKWKYKKSVYGVHRFPKGQFKYYLNMNQLICVSTAVYNALLRQTSQVKGKAIVIANPVNTNIFYPRSDKKRSDAIQIIYTGRIHPEKGLDILVRAYSNLVKDFPNLKLTLVGESDIEKGGGGEKYREHLLSLADKHTIQFLPAVSSPPELADIISQADIYCYPSIAKKGESFGVAPLEAMALGMPVIVSNLECFLDFVIPEENALVFEIGDDEIVNLSNQLRRLIVDINLRECLGCRAAEKAVRFSTEKIADSFLCDFTLLLEGVSS